MGLNRNLGNIPEVITELNGNIGIGASVPKEKLEVAGLVGNIRIYGRSGIAQNQITSNVYYNGSAWVRDTSAGAVAISLDSNAGSLGFFTTSATSGFPDERMRIFSSGNVFIGPSPSDNGNKLQVNGSISASEQLLRYSGNINSGQTISFSLNDAGFGMRLFMISAFNNANANANRMGLFMVNTRNLNYGGGNSILTLGTAQNSTGTSGEISSLSYSIGGSGTALTLNVTASIVSGSGSIQIRVQEVKWVG